MPTKKKTKTAKAGAANLKHAREMKKVRAVLSAPLKVKIGGTGRVHLDQRITGATNRGPQWSAGVEK